MKSVLEYIFDWLPFGFGVPIFIAIGMGLLADEFKAFKAARFFFYLATAWIYGKVVMWVYLTSERFPVRAIVVFVVFGFVGVALSEALRLTKYREIETAGSSPKSSQETLSTLPNLEFMATAGNAQYPAGTSVSGIQWSSRFVDLRVSIANSAATDYTDIDLTLRPDEPVAEIAQATNIPNVSFSASADPALRQEIQEGATGKRIVNPLVLILTSAGYRIRCASLPRKGRLEIVFAIARPREFPKIPKGQPKPPDGGIFSLDYVLKVDMHNGTAFWYGHGSENGRRIEAAFSNGLYLPKTVRLDGSYKIGNEQRIISEVLTVKDIMGDAIRKIRENAAAPSTNAPSNPPEPKIAPLGSRDVGGKPTPPPETSPNRNIVGQLAIFIDEGSQIQARFISSNDSQMELKEGNEWAARVQTYLIENLDPSYSIQFRNSRGNAWMGMPVNRSVEGGGYWQDIEGKKNCLNEFIRDLRQRSR